jgi:hypothetical protein
MTNRLPYPRRVACSMLFAAFLAYAPAASAQPAEFTMRAGMDEAIRALDESPRFKGLSEEKKEELVDFVLGNILFVMGHEMGHVHVNEMDLLVLGREEDAADAYAVVTALQRRSEFSERVLIEAAKGWFLSSHRDKNEGHALAFYDEHGLDLQRAYHVVCLMVGSDLDRYRRLAVEADLPEERRTTCMRDYHNASRAWDLMLKPHRRAADQPRGTINVEYKDEEKYPVYVRILRQMGVLESFATPAADGFTWPPPFSIEARACGGPNAYWTSKTQTLTLCYELVEEFAQLFADHSDAAPGESPSSAR